MRDREKKGGGRGHEERERWEDNEIDTEKERGQEERRDRRMRWSTTLRVVWTKPQRGRKREREVIHVLNISTVWFIPDQLQDGN